MMTGLLFAVAAALVLMYVLMPLTRRRAGASLAPLPWSTNGRFRGLEEQRASALEALRDLEFEFQLGNLTEEDYQRLRDRYSRRAIALLQAAEAADRQLDEEIEEAVQSVRNSRIRPASARPGPADGRLACPRCGTLARAADRSCAACGAALALGGGVPQRTLTPGPSPRGRGETTPPSLAGKGARGLGRVPRWAAVSGLLAVVFAAGVAAVYLQAASSSGQQEPIGQASVTHVHGLMVSPQDRNTVFLSHHDGLQVSRDGGRTWAPVPAVRGDGMGMVSHPADPTTVYLTGHNVFMKSADGGATWAPVAPGLPGLDIHALTGHPDQPKTLYAFEAESGLFRSVDGGSTWTLLSAQAASLTTGIAVVPGPAEVIYLATQDQGVLMSPDGGKSWSNASGFVNGALPTRQVRTIVYDPKSGDRFETGGGAAFAGALYLGTDRGVFKSIDGGQSWNALPLSSEVAALALDPADSRVLVAADSRGQVYRSSDRGLTWRGR